LRLAAVTCQQPKCHNTSLQQAQDALCALSEQLSSLETNKCRHKPIRSLISVVTAVKGRTQQATLYKNKVAKVPRAQVRNALDRNDYK
jgi:hypothetical protein